MFVKSLFFFLPFSVGTAEGLGMLELLCKLLKEQFTQSNSLLIADQKLIWIPESVMSYTPGLYPLISSLSGWLGETRQAQSDLLSKPASGSKGCLLALRIPVSLWSSDLRPTVAHKAADECRLPCHLLLSVHPAVLLVWPTHVYSPLVLDRPGVTGAWLLSQGYCVTRTQLPR